MSPAPNYPAANLLQRAVDAISSGQFDQAQAHLESVLRHDPSNTLALHHLGLRAYLSGDHARARQLLARAAASAPTDIPVLTAFATLLHDLGDPRPALDVFLRILALNPTLHEVWNAAGICFQETAQPASAIEFYLRALSLSPDFPDAHSNLASVLIHEGDTAAAIDHLHHALRINPAFAEAHSNLGIALRNRFEYAASIASLREALRLHPDHPDATSSLGEVLSLVYAPEAESVLRRALELRPSDPERHWNLALELLKRGNFAAGWREYESRWQRPNNKNPLRPFPQPLWLNEPSQTHEADSALANSTLLLYAEQGFGDTFHFLRYLPLVLSLRPARILLEVPPALLRLTQTFITQLLTSAKPPISNEIQVIHSGQPLPHFDAHTPLMSLPLAFKTTLDTVPPPLRFTPLSTLPPRPPSDPLRIGLCWSGNPKHDRDLERSIPAAILLPLLQTPNCTFVSLQVGPAARQLATLAHSSGFHLEQHPLADFLDTAQLLDTCDLVLSVDTAVAHLAASQGIPTWILLPFVAEWRWLRPSFTAPNPWYPRARLFRQRILPSGLPQTEAWQPLLAEVSVALQTLLLQRSSRT
jgi:tetratricopeptide (TPR) repeat protein